MKRFLTPALAAAVLFSACDAGQTLRVEVTDRVISSDYVGNGVEWDPYDEAEAWGAEVSDADWAKLSERRDGPLRPHAQPRVAPPPAAILSGQRHHGGLR